MDSVARLDSGKRRELFTETAARMRLLPALIEKDFWVCWTLKQLFAIPRFKTHLLFKGGTTLSKIFGVIERFSEDIDLAVDWEMLGFIGERDPQGDLSKAKRNKLLSEMLEACKHYIASEFTDTLRERITAKLPVGMDWTLEVDPADPHTVNFHYPGTTEASDYASPAVRLDLGTHAEFIPNDRYVIKPYAAEHFPGVFEEADCPVWAIQAERTFWEKATILHQEHFRTAEHAAPVRYSRQYYDVFRMAERDDIRKAALSDPDLLARVVRHKMRFFPRAWARYDLAVPDTIELMPSADWTDYLRIDYASMQEMLFGKTPSFDEILAGLRDLEGSIRTMKSV